MPTRTPHSAPLLRPIGCGAMDPTKAPMTTTTNFLTRIAAATLLACTLVPASAEPLAPADLRAAKEHVEDVYKADKDACKSVSGNARDICQAQAKGKEQVTLSEIEYRQTGKQADAVKVGLARADGEFEVAKERCDDLAGQPKSLCLTQAKAAHTTAEADAKLATTVGEAQTDARQDKAAADRKVAVEKCEILAGDAKGACLADVKARFD
jgi:hypothetical protein